MSKGTHTRRVSDEENAAECGSADALIVDGFPPEKLHLTFRRALDLRDERALTAELREALKALLLQALQSNVNNAANEWGREAIAQANAALAKAGVTP